MKDKKAIHDVVGHSSSDVPLDWIKPTSYVDSDSSDVAAFTKKALHALSDDASDKEKAIRLFEAVRDDIRYDPYQLSFQDQDYQASHVTTLEGAFCVPKAILLTACLRHEGIPAGVGFADVKNHLNSPKLADLMQTDMFVYHGYVALRLGDKCLKVTPTFNRELCDRFGVRAIEFDGETDALFHEYDAEKRQHMEYVKDRGIFEDPPMLEVIEDLIKIYPKMKEIKDREATPEADPDFAA
ncbi:transglutaminase-like domain-containing protein [Sneathiella limimaris]|uniref:transglutaminase-like domain-containing protein n=1 Tax=Sneathiella limimaris TaxID=1964213 RepID=UPI00146D7B43|nr:transglutaminase family protein [Sneathiella limimaris]